MCLHLLTSQLWGTTTETLWTTAASLHQASALSLLSVTIRDAMTSMTKERMLDILKSMGENPPKTWTKAELAQRIYELQPDVHLEGKKPVVKTNYQEWVIRMNKASRVKANLVAFSREELGLVLSGNETIAVLQRRCLAKILDVSTPEGSDVLGFGKHSQLTYETINQEYPTYRA